VSQKTLLVDQLYGGTDPLCFVSLLINMLIKLPSLMMTVIVWC